MNISLVGHKCIKEDLIVKNTTNANCELFTKAYKKFNQVLKPLSITLTDVLGCTNQPDMTLLKNTEQNYEEITTTYSPVVGESS